MTIEPRTGYFLNQDGIRLYYSLKVPPYPCAVLVVSHGFAEHLGRYEHFIDYFTNRKYAVAIFDHPGHGKSEGDVEKFDRWENDFRCFINEIRPKLPNGLPIVAVGHSVGGLAVLNYATAVQEGVKGMIISAPALKYGVSSIKEYLGYLLNPFVPKLSVPSGIDPKNISGDEESVRDYTNDPHIHKCLTVKAWHDMVKLSADTRGIADRIQGPILILQERGDRICLSKATEDFFRKIKDPNKKLLLYDRSFHEAFNDTIREKVFKDIEDWLEKLDWR
jgi:alpha-beta hydrolase superfamily lysophospholipase